MSWVLHLHFVLEPLLSNKNTFKEVKSIVIGIVLRVNRTVYSICSSSSKLLEFAHLYFVCSRESKSKVILRKFQMKELLAAVEERRKEIIIKKKLVVVLYYAEDTFMHAWPGRWKSVSTCGPLWQEILVYCHHSIIVKEESQLLNCWGHEDHLAELGIWQLMSEMLI